MKPRRAPLIAAAAALAVLLTIEVHPATAQNYPTRPVELIVTWGAGGGADQTGRKIGKLLEDRLKVSFPVENVPGSSGVTGLTKLLNGQPEGYQLGIVTADTYALLASPQPQRWKLADLAPIAVLIKQASGFFTQGSGPLKTWADVEAKAKTTELKVAVTGFGTPDELAVDELKKRGLKLVAVPFAKPGERYAAVVGGHADLLYEQAGDIRSFIDSKQLTPVLFLADKKVKPFESVTTTKEIGMNLVLDQFRTIVAKAGIPADRLKLLTEKVADAGKDPEFQKFLDEQWADPASVITGPQARAYIEKEVAALKKLTN